MAKYPKIHTTNKGRELVSMANVQNKAVTYTKAVLGDGTFSGNIDTLTNIIAAKMECPFNSATNIGDGQFQLNFVIDNGNLQSGFYAREVGIFAKIDNGEEILFAYTNGGNYVDYIPDKSTPIDAQIIEADINIGDAESVTIVKSDSTYITFKDLENHDNNADAHNVLMTKHNTNATAHADIRTKITSDMNAHNTSSSAHTAILDAIKAISGTDAYDIAPSSTLSSLIPLVGYGGIVAQRLETNGYVKFANGLTFQWGTHSNIPDGTVVSFPISFTTSCYSIAGNDMAVQADSSMQVMSFANLNNSGFTSNASRINGNVATNNFRYICVGV